MNVPRTTTYGASLIVIALLTVVLRSPPSHTQQTTDEIPSGAVVFLELEEDKVDRCPVGWSELADARGRYLVVADPNDPRLGGVDPIVVGNALADQEDRPVGQHTHTVSDPKHRHELKDDEIRGGNASGDANGDPPYAAAFDWADVGVPELAVTTRNSANLAMAPPEEVEEGTNAPYVQLLACEKD